MLMTQRFSRQQTEQKRSPIDYKWLLKTRIITNDKWKIKINEEKTQAIIFLFDNKIKRKPDSALKVGVSNVDFKPEISYLDVKLDAKLNFAAHINMARDKGINCLKALYPILASDKITISIKLIIYKSMIRPVFTYASTTWRQAANTHITTLQRLQNKCLKLIAKHPPWYPTQALHNELNIATEENFLIENENKFIERCNNSEFEIIRNIVN